MSQGGGKNSQGHGTDLIKSARNQTTMSRVYECLLPARGRVADPLVKGMCLPKGATTGTVGRSMGQVVHLKWVDELLPSGSNSPHLHYLDGLRTRNEGLETEPNDTDAPAAGNQGHEAETEADPETRSQDLSRFRWWKLMMVWISYLSMSKVDTLHLWRHVRIPYRMPLLMYQTVRTSSRIDLLIPKVKEHQSPMSAPMMEDLKMIAVIQRRYTFEKDCSPQKKNTCNPSLWTNLSDEVM